MEREVFVAPGVVRFASDGPQVPRQRHIGAAAPVAGQREFPPGVGQPRPDAHSVREGRGGLAIPGGPFGFRGGPVAQKARRLAGHDEQARMPRTAQQFLADQLPGTIRLAPMHGVDRRECRLLGPRLASHRPEQQHARNRRQQPQRQQPRRPLLRTVAGQPTRARRGDPTGRQRHRQCRGLHVQTVVEKRMRTLRGQHREGAGDQAQLRAARQPARRGNFARQTQSGPPPRCEMDDEEQTAQREARAPVFHEQLQPVVVRMHRPAGQTRAAVAQRQLVEHVGPRPEPRIQREHRRHHDEPERLAVSIESHRIQTHAHRDTFQRQGKSEKQRDGDRHQGTRREPETVRHGPPGRHHETDQRERGQTRRHAHVSGPRKTQRQPGKTRRRGPQEEKFDRRASASPDEQTQGEEGRSLQHGGERTAAGQRPRNETRIRTRPVAARQPQVRRQIGQRVERRLRGELHHDQDGLPHTPRNQRAEHEPAHAVTAQLPCRREVDGQRAEHEPGVIPRGIGVGARRLAPQQVTAEEQHRSRAPSRRCAPRTPEQKPGQNRGRPDQQIARHGERRIPPAAEQNLGHRQPGRQKRGGRPVKQSGEHRTPI